MNVRSNIRSMLERKSAARDKLAHTLAECGKLSDSDAKLVADFYIRNKLVKLDPIHGTAHVKHGGFYNADALKRALVLANGGTL